MRAVLAKKDVTWKARYTISVNKKENLTELEIIG